MINWGYNNRVLKLKLRSIDFLIFLFPHNQFLSQLPFFVVYLSIALFSLTVDAENDERASPSSLIKRFI
jgi:hypothetical protein